MICCVCANSTTTAPCGGCGQDPRLDGRYVLESVLSRSATSTTYRGRRGDVPVVIKETPVRWAADEERALSEARVLGRLDHPQIPACVEHLFAGEGKQRSLFLVQAHVPGEDLRSHLQTHRYTEPEVLDVLSELCGVLSYLHTLSPPVIHRNVEPRNVLRRPDGGLALVDFGAVRDAPEGASLGDSPVVGTLGFVAPEQLRGDADARTDLYGLGALAVALLTRKEPSEMIGDDRIVRWRPHAHASPRTSRLLDALLQPDPSRRPDTARVVRDWIERIQTAPAPPAVPVRPGAVAARLSAAAMFSTSLAAMFALALSSAFLVGGALFLRIGAPRPSPVAHAPPAWHLDLPDGLPAERVPSLLDRGRQRLGVANDRGALQDFYRIWQAQPSRHAARDGARLAGERLVLADLEQQLQRSLDREVWGSLVSHDAGVQRCLDPLGGWVGSLRAELTIQPAGRVSSVALSARAGEGLPLEEIESCLSEAIVDTIRYPPDQGRAARIVSLALR